MRPAASTPTLARHWIPERSFLSDLGLVVGFSLFTGLMAHVAIPLPFTPVPITGQTFAVLLCGALLGSRLGTASMLLYITEGMVGLPIFLGAGSTPGTAYAQVPGESFRIRAHRSFAAAR